jgi:hypothetical protein
MTALSSFVLIGTVVSHDPVLATVEFNLNPATNGGPAIGIMTVASIPCEVKVGKKIYIVKEENQKIPVISCDKEG